MPQKKAKLGFCLLVGLLLAVALPSVAIANHEDYPAEGFGGVQPHVAQAGHEIQDIFGVPYVGGYRAGDPQDHGKGLALDFMVYDDAVLGDRVSNHILANWGHYNVSYIIWKQRINFGSGWQPMEDRGSPTQNHFDHVHVSFNPESSNAVAPPVEEAPEREDPSVGGPPVVEEEPVTRDDIEEPTPNTGAEEPVRDNTAGTEQPSTGNNTGEPATTTTAGGDGRDGADGRDAISGNAGNAVGGAGGNGSDATGGNSGDFGSSFPFGGDFGSNFPF